MYYLVCHLRKVTCPFAVTVRVVAILLSFVAGLVPAIHVYLRGSRKTLGLHGSARKT
jgi:hypothetical protein